MNKNYDYSIIFDLIEAYHPQRFNNINPGDPLIQKLDRFMDLNDQMLKIMDLNEMKVIYNSKHSLNMLGIHPKKNSPYEMLCRVHECDLPRFGLARTKLLKMDKDLYISKSETRVFSSTCRMRKPDNTYCNHLFQFYLFYSPIFNTVFSVQVNTNVDRFKMKKDTFHHYAGDDISHYRFPDEELLEIGHDLTCREFEIVKLIAEGHTSDEIAGNLFLSIHTIRSHRKNILRKYHKSHLSDIILLFKDQGLF